MRRGRRSATKIKFFFNFLFPLCPESIWDRGRRGRSQSSRCLLVARPVGFGMGRRRERPRPPTYYYTFLHCNTSESPPPFLTLFMAFLFHPLPFALKRGGVPKRFGGGGGGGPICNPPPCCPPADTHFPILHTPPTPPPPTPSALSLCPAKTLARTFFTEISNCDDSSEKPC